MTNSTKHWVFPSLEMAQTVNTALSRSEFNDFSRSMLYCVQSSVLHHCLIVIMLHVAVQAANSSRVKMLRRP